MQEAARVGRYYPGHDFESIPLSTHCCGGEKISFGGDITRIKDRIDCFHKLNGAWNGIPEWHYR